LPADQLEIILAQMNAAKSAPAPTAAPDAPDSPEVAAIKLLPTDTIQKFLDGGFEDEATYGFRLEQLLQDASVSLEDIAQATAARKALGEE